MKLLIWIIMFIYLCAPFSAMAEGQVKMIQNQSNEQSENANSPSPDNNNRFELPNKSIIQNVKPIDLDRVAKKVEEKGEKAYKVLQSGSIPYFVVVLAISLFFLFLGLFIKKLIMVGVGGLFLAFCSFLIINFAPELMQVFIQTVHELFTS